jgi:hypothetical protein
MPCPSDASFSPCHLTMIISASGAYKLGNREKFLLRLRRIPVASSILVQSLACQRITSRSEAENPKVIFLGFANPGPTFRPFRPVQPCNHNPALPCRNTTTNTIYRQEISMVSPDFPTNNDLRTNFRLKRYSHISSLCPRYLPHIPGPAFSFPIAGQPSRK